MTVLNRVMFRQQGSPMTGEMYNFDIPMKQKPEMDDYTKAVSSDEFQSFLFDAYGDKGQGILDILLQGNTPENFSYLTDLLNQFTNYKISNEMKEKGAIPQKPFEIPEQELNYLNRLKYKAEGSPMEGETVDAVGIADGLDSEEEVSMTAESGSSEDGIAKVSPEQYVQLMNEIRGDDVPLEGRVQELAMTVGEQDAQATPLSVLTLVQPVFELQEQQGIGSTQQAQNMMPTASEQLNQPMSDGIVRAESGLFADLSNVTGKDPTLMESLANIYGINQTPVDISKRSKELTDIYLEQANLKDKALLAAAPGLLSIGSTLLDPEAEMTDIAKEIALETAKLGATVGSLKDPYVKAGLNQAFAEEQERKKTFNDFRTKIGEEAIKKIFTEEKFTTDGYTGFSVGEISGLPRPDQRQAYYNKKLELDFKNSEEMAKMNAVNSLLTLPDLSQEDKAQIRLDPTEWLKKNKEKTVGMSDSDRNKQENLLREEFTKNNKNFIVQADSFAKIKTSAANPSPAGDLALIFNFMKMLDPQSTVRESEFQNAANAAPLLTKLGIDFNKISTVWEGKTLTDPQRKDFLTKTLALYEQGKLGYDRLVNGYKGLAELYEVRPEAVLGIDFSLPDSNINIDAAILDEEYDLEEVFNPKVPKK